MMQEKIIYPQLPTPSKQWQLMRPIRWVATLLRDLFALIGVLVVGAGLFFYTQGQQATEKFDTQFMTFFGQFIERLLVSDMLDAMMVKTPIEQGVKIQDVIKSIQTAAPQNRMNLVARHALSKSFSELSGKEARFLEIFELADLQNSLALVSRAPDYAMLMPYRIMLYEDANNQLWLATFNLNLFAHSTARLDETMQLQLQNSQESLLKIINAGASGVLP
ncbi:hypothetical protein BegalDRAFT_1600 [Beggiatoa alba B18LD]|uniref:DUF302 domain-containing protein n=1 Tax=Beggiatoa alba B18LD TaxID=395493 RepID=I3CFT6_9GAMM|nr:hypothetical protein [Beggiatoa alba]EIJ42479.1 hypothetical protein BegalDRAFT_1600 [Beggiatoa alba B18LD]